MDAFIAEFKMQDTQPTTKLTTIPKFFLSSFLFRIEQKKLPLSKSQFHPTQLRFDQRNNGKM